MIENNEGLTILELMVRRTIEGGTFEIKLQR